MNKFLTILCVCLFAAFSVKAQTIDNRSLGFRFGGTSGISFKKHTSNRKAFEGILGYWYNGFSLTGLFQKHTRAFNQPGLRWYYGYGAHLATFNTNGPGDNFARGERDFENDEIGFGVDGLIELQYRFPSVPLSLSLSLKPFIEIDTDGGIHAAPDPAFSIRFHFRSRCYY